MGGKIKCKQSRRGIVSPERKRGRESYDDDTLTAMEEAWQNGMRSSKEKEKMKALAQKTNLSVEKIEEWIGNRRAKDRRGGAAPAYIKKKAAVKGPSSYTLFSQQFKRETSSKEEHFKTVAKKWGELSQEERLRYRDDARGIRSSDLKGMSADEAITHHFKQVENSINVLGSLGFEVMMVAVKDQETPHLLGTNKGLQYIGQPQVLEPFRRAVFGNTVYIKQPSKKGKGDLRTEVRQVLNSCWEKATGESKPIPYSSLLKGKVPWKLEGLPVPVKEPSNYGIGDLKKIMDNKTDIKFVKTQVTQGQPESAEEIVDSIISNQLALETVHDLCDDDGSVSSKEDQAAQQSSDSKQAILGTDFPTEEPAGPKIPLELVDDMSTLFGLKQDEESAIVSLDKLEKKNTTKRKMTVTNPTEKKKTSQTKKRKSSLGMKESPKYEIDYLVDERGGEAGQEFLVKWKGYSISDQTWEPVSSLPPTALSLYWQKKYSKDTD